MNTRTLLALLVLAAPLPAFAHAHLESSIPAKGAVVAASPDSVMLMFSEAVELTSLTVQKTGDKAPTVLGPLPKADGQHLMVPLPKLADGAYTLSWRALSSDQHEAKGTIAFTVSADGKAAAPASKDCCAKRMDSEHDHGTPPAK